MRKVSIYSFIAILIILFLMIIGGCGGGDSSGTVPNPPVNPTATPVGNFSERYSIEEINQILDSEGLTWDAEDNPIYRLTDEKFKSMMGDVPELATSSESKKVNYISKEYLEQKQDLPASFCWEWMTPVKHQGEFGSCVSFATIGAIEGLIKAKTMVDINFSERALHCFDYPHDPANPQSEGWNILLAAPFVVNQGLASEVEAPYGNGDTVYNEKSDILLDVPTGINYVKHLTGSDEVILSETVVINASDSEEARRAIKQALLSGPCATRFDVPIIFNAFYNSNLNLFDPVNNTINRDVISQGPVFEDSDLLKNLLGNYYYTGGHAVTLIGWDDTRECWICRNSWGLQWGVGGYFMIGYGETNICENVVKYNLASAPTAHIEIDHPYRGDLVVKVGCGSPYTPYWTKIVSNREGGAEDNIYTDISIPEGAAYWPPDENNIWFLQVSDVSSGDTGKVKKFTITYSGQTYTSENPSDLWTSVEDNTTSYAYVPRPQYTRGKVIFHSDRDKESKKYNLYIMNSNGSQQFNLSNYSAGNDMIAKGNYRGASPGGARIAFHSRYNEQNEKIYVMNADGSNHLCLTDSRTENDFYPCFSKDSTKIVYSSNRSDYTEIYIMIANGGSPTPLTSQNADIENSGFISAAYSPVENKIVYTSEVDGNREIYTMNDDGSNKTRLTNNSVSDYYPCYSEDGTKIVFTSHRSGGDSDIFVMNSDGSGTPVNLTSNCSDEDWFPTWCPYTHKIYFATDRDGNDEVYVMNPDGSGQANLSQNSAIDRYVNGILFNQPKN